jgi:hypothetical protein
MIPSPDQKSHQQREKAAEGKALKTKLKILSDPG